jgi:hypothetical protein
MVWRSRGRVTGITGREPPRPESIIDSAQATELALSPDELARLDAGWPRAGLAWGVRLALCPQTRTWRV